MQLLKVVAHDPQADASAPLGSAGACVSASAASADAALPTRDPIEIVAQLLARLRVGRLGVGRLGVGRLDRVGRGGIGRGGGLGGLDEAATTTRRGRRQPHDRLDLAALQVNVGPRRALGPGKRRLLH